METLFANCQIYHFTFYNLNYLFLLAKKQ